MFSNIFQDLYCPETYLEVHALKYSQVLLKVVSVIFDIIKLSIIYIYLQGLVYIIVVLDSN